MKKVLLIVMMMASFMHAKAQNYATYNVWDIPNQGCLYFCAEEYDGVIIYGSSIHPDGDPWAFGYDGEWFHADSIVLYPTEELTILWIHHDTFSPYNFNVVFVPSSFPNPIEPYVWKRLNETVYYNIELLLPDPYLYYVHNEWHEQGYEYLWSTGETGAEIYLT